MSTYRSFLPELRDAPVGTGDPAAAPDRRDGSVYVVDEQTRLAVDVALATGRPLLLRGEAGSGKSSLAGFVARNLGWRYYEHVVTSRTRAQDLLWTFDAVRKLAAASGGEKVPPDLEYVEPGVLWWMFDRQSALRRGAEPDAPPATPAAEPGATTNAQRSPAHAVVLVDEIDKADPDVPNGLLVPLGSTEFLVAETGTLVRRAPTGEGGGAPSDHLTIVTTNEERDLPPAFLRRCVVATLTPPGRERLIEIARRHVEQAGAGVEPADTALFGRLADVVERLRGEAERAGLRPPSTAEYLDAVHACRALGVRADEGDETWQRIERLVLTKEQPGTLAP